MIFVEKMFENVRAKYKGSEMATIVFLVVFFFFRKKTTYCCGRRLSVRLSLVEITLVFCCTTTDKPIDLKFSLNIGGWVMQV